MDSHRALEWVQRNRAVRDRTRLAGEVAAQCLMGDWSRDASLQTAMLEGFAGVEDPVFSDHCRYGGVREGVVCVWVDRPELVNDMRIRFHLPLRDALRRSVQRRVIRGIEFRYQDARR